MLVEALRERKELPALAADESVVGQYGREFFRTHRVSREAWQAGLEQFGRQGVVELGLILGNYSLLALLIYTFDSDLPPDRTEPLLPVYAFSGQRCVERGPKAQLEQSRAGTKKLKEPLPASERGRP